jgi:hypothetical protein
MTNGNETATSNRCAAGHVTGSGERLVKRRDRILRASLTIGYGIPLVLFLSACTSSKDKERIAQLENRNAQMEQEIRVLTAAKAHEVVPESEVYTLYRSSDFGPNLRVHVGTFDTRSFDDAAQNKQYNYEICSDAQLNFNERNKGRLIRFWCEEGRFKEKLR